MATEQRNIVGVGYLAQDVLVPVEVDYGMSMTRELHVHEHHLGPRRTQPIDAILNRLAELVDLCAAHCICRTRLPDHQCRLQGNNVTVQAGSHLLGRLTRHGAVEHRHARIWEAAGKGHGETRWPGKIRAASRLSER